MSQQPTNHQMLNPDLPNPVTGGERGLAVSAPAALTKPMGTTLLSTFSSYVCTVPNASTHREDGKKLPFVFGFMRTNIKQDIDFMEKEIDSGNIYFRRATKQEMQDYDMRTDPRGTLTKSITEELEPQLRKELEEKIRAEMAAANRDATKIAGVDSRKRAAETIAAAGATIRMQSQAAPITPVSTVDVKDATVSSGR